LSIEQGRIEGDFPVYFRYTAGIAGEKFLREIMEHGRLVASRCSACELNYLPPRIYCEQCMSTLTEYVPIENAGTVETYTYCYADSEGNKLPEPVGVALVRFKGAHGGLVHKTRGRITTGDKVCAVFKERSKRTGSILDIECFEKVP